MGIGKIKNKKDLKQKETFSYVLNTSPKLD